VKNDVQQRVAKIQGEMEDIQKQYEQLTNKTCSEAKELQEYKEALEKEQRRLHLRVCELDRREYRLNQHAREFEEQCKEWQERLATKETQQNGVKESQHLLISVKEANEEVEKDRTDLTEKLVKAEEARAKLAASEKVLKERVECLQNFLSFVEQQGLLPEAVHFRKLLKAIKHLPLPGMLFNISVLFYPII
jgi:chromosome segregation ATPase